MSHALSARIATVYELQSAWLEPHLRELGVRWTTFQLLATIYGAEKGISQIEVAQRLGVAPATMSESVQLHVDKGLIRREADVKDKRVKLLVLTQEGRAIMSKIGLKLRELEAVVAAELSQSESATCAKALDKIIQLLELKLDEKL